VSQGKIFDPGLQNERTSLAWFRTGLSFAGAGALVLHASEGLRRPGPGLLGVMALAVAGLTVMFSSRRYRRTDEALRRGGSVCLSGAVVRAVAAVTMSLSLGLLATTAWGLAG